MKIASRSLSQRLIIYGLGAGAITGVAAAAHHGHGAKKKKKPKNTIRYSGPEYFSDSDIFFDLQNQVPPSDFFYPGDDFKLSSKCGKIKPAGFTKYAGVSGYYAGSGDKSKVAVNFNSGTPQALRLHAGQIIGTQTFSFYGTMERDYYSFISEQNYRVGQWRPGNRGFLGLVIKIGCNRYFGWADVTFNSLQCEAPTFTLNSYAIETCPNVAIKAGQKKSESPRIIFPCDCNPRPSPSLTSTPTPTPVSTPTPTPEPTTTPTPTPVPIGGAIALLIAGAAGIGAFREQYRNR